MQKAFQKKERLLKKNVQISITGIQETDGEPEKYELVTDGELESDEDHTILSYMESKLTGLDGTKTTFDVAGGRVILTREGAISSQMLFEEGRKHYTLYETPVGAVTMGVNTLGMSSSLKNGVGNLDIHYVIDVDSSVVSRNRFKISIREV